MKRMIDLIARLTAGMSSWARDYTQGAGTVGDWDIDSRGAIQSDLNDAVRNQRTAVATMMVKVVERAVVHATAESSVIRSDDGSSKHSRHAGVAA